MIVSHSDLYSLDQSNLVFFAWKHYPLWTCLHLCPAAITFFYIYYACMSKEKFVLCLCPVSLWPICQCTCLGLWPASITLFPYLLCMPIRKKTCPMFMPCGLQFAKNILMLRPARLHLWIFSLIPCLSGIVENRYPPNIGDNTLPKICFSKFGEF